MHAALAASWPHIEGWVPNARRDEILALSCRLPALWRWGVLELRLAEDDDRVDLMACACDVEHDRSDMREHLDLEVLGTGARMLNAWSGKPSWRKIPVVWLEWDLPLVGRRSTLSFACVDSSLLHRGAPVPSRAEQLLLVDEVLRVAVTGRSEQARLLRGIARCVTCLPPAARLVHIGPLAPRDEDGCRLVINIGASELLVWLRAIRWPGDLAAVERWSRAISSAEQRFLIHCDVTDAPRPYLALETGMSRARTDHEAKFVRDLDELGLAKPDRIQRALNWPGRDPESTSNTESASVINRSTYFKLGFLRDGRLEAKAYLGFHFAESDSSSA